MDFLASHIELPEGHFGFLPCFSGSICSAPPGKASMRLSFPDDWLEGRRSSELHEGWLLHPIHKNSGDDFGMVYGIGFTALNIHTHIYIYIHEYTCIHIYIFLWYATNECQKSESINFNCSERFESCKLTSEDMFNEVQRKCNESSTKFKRWTS